MPHDSRTYTVSRYEGSATWHAAIQPASRAWILYVDKEDVPYLYRRELNTVDADGNVLERYVFVRPATSAECSG